MDPRSLDERGAAGATSNCQRDGEGEGEGDSEGEGDATTSCSDGAGRAAWNDTGRHHRQHTQFGPASFDAEGKIRRVPEWALSGLLGPSYFKVVLFLLCLFLCV